jgi:hypothetical protein
MRKDTALTYWGSIIPDTPNPVFPNLEEYANPEVFENIVDIKEIEGGTSAK